MIGFCPLASGSKGNCIYFGSPQKKILIDAGISAKHTLLRLKEINVDLKDIDAILITHPHIDHIQGLKMLAYKMKIPVFANYETAREIVDTFHDCPKFKIFSTGETFEFGDLEIHPFSIQHDTIDPVGFTIRNNHLKIGFCTDLGFATSLVIKNLQDCDYLYVEASHKVSMVEASSRPRFCKDRLLGRLGHLSNEACAMLLTQVYSDKLKLVMLAHLSKECNTPEIALEVVQNALIQKGFSTTCKVASQEKISDAVYF